MAATKVAKRYALGLLDFAKEQNAVEQIFGEMQSVKRILGQSKDLQNFFSTPFIEAKKKEAAAAQIFAQFSVPVQNFIKLTIKQGRETELANIAQQYIIQVENMMGIQRISLTTATEISEENVRQILQSTRLFDASKKYDIEKKIDASLLGGYILRVGDQQIDASVKSKLNGLRKEFSA